MNKNKYLPSIDSLRAIAVLSVIIYHCNSAYLPGGFMGVDLFFVLSGYLISSLIIKEYKETNDLNLFNFYVRRARRLLPAVYLMITVVLIIMVLFNKNLLNKSYLDAIFGYIYSSNWWNIFHKVDYFDSFGSLSPFKHLWSLAIEEQFYMFFPFIIFILIKSKFKDKIFHYLKYCVLFLILLSFITHIYLFDINNINRVYYGTDTRIFELLVGVLGSIFYPIENFSKRVNKKTNITYSFVSVFSILLFIMLMNYVSEYSKFLYYGGFLLFSFLFLIIIITTGQQTTFISKAMSFKPLVYIGKISYSLYLWHFPILILTTPSSEIGNPNFYLNVLRIILIFIVAYLSYKFVESPIRKIGFYKFINNIYCLIKTLNFKKKMYITSSSSIIFILFIMGIFGKSVPFISEFSSSENIEKKETEFTNNTNNTENKTSEEKNTENNEESKVYNKIILIGDSLAIDVGKEFIERYPGAIVDGKISRQVYNSINIVKDYSSFNKNTTAVIFMLGTNGAFEEKHLDELLKHMDNSDIYFVNTRVPRPWEKTVNKILDESKEKYNNFTLIDWYSASKNHNEYFTKDRVHLEKAGIIKLVDLISTNLKKEVKTDDMIEIEKQKEQKVEQEKNHTEKNNTTNSNNNKKNN